MPTVYRLVKRRYPVFDGSGAALEGARWNSPGRSVIYASEHYATALLEKLVHAGRTGLPGSHHAAAILIPDDIRLEALDPATLPGWDADDSGPARAYGDSWHASLRSAVLIVPSIPGQPIERNFIINPAHPDAVRMQVGQPFEVVWDGRLFGPPFRMPERR
ncbi:MAG TPA: RES domain-containing protein [Gemmatimonadales bacterium]|nr:RES domain-containing protein [Gemmatimonadales bacterium]